MSPTLIWSKLKRSLSPMLTDNRQQIDKSTDYCPSGACALRVNEKPPPPHTNNVVYSTGNRIESAIWEKIAWQQENCTSQSFEVGL